MFNTIYAFILPLMQTYSVVQNSNNNEQKGGADNNDKLNFVSFLKKTMSYQSVFFFVLTSIIVIKNAFAYLDPVMAVGAIIGIGIFIKLGLFNSTIPTDDNFIKEQIAPIISDVNVTSEPRPSNRMSTPKPVTEEGEEPRSSKRISTPKPVTEEGEEPRSSKRISTPKPVTEEGEEPRPSKRISTPKPVTEEGEEPRSSKRISTPKPVTETVVPSSNKEPVIEEPRPSKRISTPKQQIIGESNNEQNPALDQPNTVEPIQGQNINMTNNPQVGGKKRKHKYTFTMI
jgi:hypothetical protein